MPGEDVKGPMPNINGVLPDTKEIAELKAKLEGLRPLEQSDRGPMKSSSAGPDRMLKWFEYGHLPAHLQAASAPFMALANHICSYEPGPERTVALRKLLEAKDAAVRAALHPGG